MAQRGSFHENLGRSHVAAPSSERSFAMVIAAVLAIFGLWPLWNDEPVRWWLLAAAAVLLAVGLAAPNVLKPVNRGWLWLGLALGRIVTPVVMGLIYALTVVPIGLIMRWMGKDLLNLRIDRDAKSYWIERRPPGPEPQTMRNQF